MKELLSRAVVFVRNEAGAEAAGLGGLAAGIAAGAAAMLAAWRPALGAAWAGFFGGGNF